MEESLRAGIIGAGWAGSGHAAAYSRLPGVTVAGLWSRTRARAEELAGQLDQTGLQVYDNWEDLIEKGDLDAISIAVPPVLRREPVQAALERSLSVLVEKPFTANLHEAQHLTRMAEDTHVVSAVSFNWRYSPGSQVAKHAVQERAVGQISDLSITWSIHFVGDTEASFSDRPWTARTETGGGLMRQGGSHDFDRARFLTGLEVTRLVGRLVPASVPGTNTDLGYLLLTELSNGGSATFSTRLTPGEGQWKVTLFGDEGTLRADHQQVVRQCRGDDAPVSLAVPASDQVPEGTNLLQHTWNRLIADFCAAVRETDVAHESVPHLPTFADGLRVQELIAGAERSEAERRWVGLPELAE